MDTEMAESANQKNLHKSGGRWRVKRYLTAAGADVWASTTWVKRDARVTAMDGTVVFEQLGVEFPENWSQTAVNVVVNKYFRGALGSPERETSVRQLVGRVANTISDWGVKDGYFIDGEEAGTFRDELTYLLLHQFAAFNSPVWFNCGVDETPQVSACFINSVVDSMGDIMDLAKTEAMLFKHGSGAGCNLSAIRSSQEMLKGGGEASGPVSFMRGFDAFAGVIKSGGKTRRAAKMVMLDCDHPDIETFINCKMDEEKKAWALIDAGYDGGFNVPGGAYDSVFFQNANHSVRVTDAFMEAVVEGGTYATRAVTDGRDIETLDAGAVLDQIAEATHLCGDPGLQYDTTINDWHTCSATDRIFGSNPCSEYMFLNDTACNLASLNLMKFRRQDGSFDVELFDHAAEVVFMAQEIMVDNASYPTERIGANSHRFRPLGLGFANLGALLMARGLPYDSDGGRAYAGAITALMCGAAYRCSADMAERKGAFEGFEENRHPMMQVMQKHRDSVDGIDAAMVPKDMLDAARNAWDQVLQKGALTGLRNSQATVLAPTGTIAFMMDCDTTGVEPDIALVKYKKMVGGGMMKLVNNTVELGLIALGYDDDQIARVRGFIDTQDTIEGAPDLKPEHLPVFDCAFKAAKGVRSIHHMGHLKMMGAAQPFLSGAISKTVNMPEDCTVEAIREAYIEAWKMGIKAVAIYRDNSKRTQPLNTSLEAAGAVVPSATPAARPKRRRLPDTRDSVTHKFSVGGHEGYITVGLYEDRTPGELFAVMSKEGSVVSGLIDGFSTMVSLALQYGVPLEVMVRKFTHTRFEPSGFTGNKEIPIAKSVLDYMFRWLDLRFAHTAELEEGLQLELPGTAVDAAAVKLGKAPSAAGAEGPLCTEGCGPTIPNGGCYICPGCGTTTGCG
jgi:ribonucleoside-diphosphate reductase alpha chain